MWMSIGGCRSKATQSPDANELQKVIVVNVVHVHDDEDAASLDVPA